MNSKTQQYCVFVSDSEMNSQFFQRFQFLCSTKENPTYIKIYSGPEHRNYCLRIQICLDHSFDFCSIKCISICVMNAVGSATHPPPWFSSPHGHVFFFWDGWYFIWSSSKKGCHSIKLLSGRTFHSFFLPHNLFSFKAFNPHILKVPLNASH